MTPWHLRYADAHWRLTRDGIPETRLCLRIAAGTGTEEMALARIVALLNAAEGVPSLCFDAEMERIAERMEEAA